jgi:uncharacterized delta-60 repeat protein
MRTELIRVTGIAGVVCVVLGLAAPARAQAVDTFNPASNNYIYAIAVQPDGKILVGGDFTSFGCDPGCGPASVARSKIARLNADGSVDVTFDPGADGPVNAIVVQPDGKIIIAGAFANVGGGGSGSTPRKYLARLNPDGTVDPGFNPGVNMNNSVYAVALQPDGKILVGGGFYAGLGGAVRYYFGRLNADGVADPGFAPGVDGPVQTIAIQGDGRILLGGLFTHAGGEFGDTERHRIARLDANGTVDMTFNPGANNRVESIAVQADGKILVGGIFTGLGGGTGTTPRFNIGRLEADGTVDQNFIPGANGLVYTFAVQADGRILVGGAFTMFGGGGTGANVRNNIARLNPDGSLDPFDPGAEEDVRAIAVQMDGHFVLGGTFSGLGAGTGATSRSYIGRVLNSDPALQSVTVADGGTTVTWLRNGTMPEVAFVDFASSTNGVTYTPLGSGTRIVGGWRVTGVTLPVHPDLTLRMRAYYPTGQRGASSSMIEWIVPAADFNTIENGDFTLGLSGWLFFATPDMTYITHNVTAEVLNFFRTPPPPGTTNQAVAFQQTGVPLSANVPLIAEFDLGNSSSVRKRVSILIHDSDFSDLSVCTFWLPANSPLTTYGMTTHTTKPWVNLTIAFYAASAGSNGGFYQIDNVSVRYSPGGSTTETMCEDALAPTAPGGAASPTLLVNGDFGSGTVGPGWSLFGQIDGGVTAGAFEFTKLAGTPSGVILQQTGQAVAANELLTATFQLGNFSGVRQRVTVIMHDADFSDLSACTFWLAPGQPLSTYTYRSFATEAWTNATLSVYPATVGTVRSTRLDNVTMQRTPSAVIGGTECLEPASPINLLGRRARAASSAPKASTAADSSAQARTAARSARGGGAPPADLWQGWVAAASDARVHVLERGPIDLTWETDARLLVASWLRSTASRATIQISADGGLTWDTIHTVGASDSWTKIEIDLSAYAGSMIHVRFVFEGVAPADDADPDMWRLGNIEITKGDPRSIPKG